MITRSIVGTQDLADVFALHAAGRTKVIAQERHLDDVNLCIEEVLSGQVPATGGVHLPPGGNVPSRRGRRRLRVSTVRSKEILKLFFERTHPISAAA